MVNNNKIFALVGPYASGKSTLINKLIDIGITYIPTYTTKNPTAADEGSRTLKFLSQNAFLQQEWLVKVSCKGDYYGILKKDLLLAIRDHKISVCFMDINGVKQVKKLLNNNLETVFIMVDYISLVDRMIKMHHSNTDIKYHLEYAETNGEFDNWKSCNHVIKNVGSVDKAFNQLLAIMGLSVPAPPHMIQNL